MAKIPGGVSATMAACLEGFFTGGGNDVSTVGILLDLPDGSDCRLFLKLDQMIQDDAAHKYIWSCVGATGTKFCMLCLNALSHSSGEVDEEGEETLMVDIMTRRQLHLATSAQIFEAFDRLDAYVAANPLISATALLKHEQHLGFKRSPHGLMRNPRIAKHLKPASQFIHDWMHVMAVQGVINIAMFHCLRVLNDFGVTWEMVKGYCSTWHLPHSAGGGARNPSEVLKAKRVTAYKKAKRIKCQASEIISLLPLVAMFVGSIVLPGAAGDLSEVELCCQVRMYASNLIC